MNAEANGIPFEITTNPSRKCGKLFKADPSVATGERLMRSKRSEQSITTCEKQIPAAISHAKQEY